MRIKPFIRFPDKLSVKTLFATALFVASNKQNGPASGIKSESDPPHAVFGLEANLLHVGVARSVKSVYPRMAQLGPKLLKKFRMRKQLILHRNGQALKFGVKSRVEIDFPTHGINMT